MFAMSINKNFKKYWVDIIEVFLKMRKLKKRKNADTKNKNMPDPDRERKKEYMQNYYYKRKNFFNLVINHVKELERVCLNKQIFKYCKKFLNSRKCKNRQNSKKQTHKKTKSFPINKKKASILNILILQNIKFSIFFQNIQQKSGYPQNIFSLKMLVEDGSTPKFLIFFWSKILRCQLSKFFKTQNVLYSFLVVHIGKASTLRKIFKFFIM